MSNPWYRIVTLRKEVREGRSFSPDEFAIALEQVVAGTAPDDYRDPEQFFARTCFTGALTEHAGVVLRRLAARTENTAPVLWLFDEVLNFVTAIADWPRVSTPSCRTSRSRSPAPVESPRWSACRAVRWR